jgi:signal transduction histidine kinase
LQQLRDAAAAEERVRLARDLHDGVLQSLTAAALNLETAQRLVDADPQGARERLRDIQGVIAAEQRDLRTHIEQLKPPYSRGPHVNEDLAGRFRELAGQIERQWSTRIEMDLGAQAERFPAGITQHLYFILHEALINAARHARASCIRAEIGLEAPDRLRIVVADDGCGFPFHGRHDHAALNAMKAGPVTLRERIASLGGSLTIDSSSAGSRLEITLPLPGKGG